MTPDDIRDAVLSHPAVDAVTLIGSRARGDAGRFSDWDFEVMTDEFDRVADALPSMIEPLGPLATLWDPLADNATFMTILHGPTKVDLIFDEPITHDPPYDVRPDTLPAIDAHFWDWSLWLVSKRAKGKTDLLADELRKMGRHILAPMGIPSVPKTLEEAVDLYVSARTRSEQSFGIDVPKQLGNEVTRVIRESGRVS